MKLNRLAWHSKDQDETIAIFGDARLVKPLNGRLQVVGGSANDHTAAKEWVSLFMHEAAVSYPAVRRSNAFPRSS
jgi:hypothetical protein